MTLAQPSMPFVRSPRRPPPSATARALFGLEMLLAVGALAGGAALFSYPDGSALRMPLSMLEHSGFTSFRVPGFILFVVIGLLPLAGAIATLRRLPWAA